MNSFDYATVDFTAFEIICKQLNSKEIFNMALKTNFDVLKRLASLSTTPHTSFIDVAMETEKMRISLGFEDTTQNFKISFGEELNPRAAFTIITAHGAAQLLRTLKNVQILFTGSISRMTMDLEVLDEEALVGLADIQCEKLTVTGHDFPLSREEVAEALSKIKVTKQYGILSFVGHKVLPAHLPSENLFLNYATGITQADLLSMAGTVKNIDLRGSTLTSEDVHEFIKTWFESRECTTVSLRVIQRDQETWDLQKVLQGIPHGPWQEWMRDRSFISARRPQPGNLYTFQIEDLGDAVDIDRDDKGLGLIGSVLITRPKRELFFCVWHNRHEMETLIVDYRARLEETERQIRTYPFEVVGNQIRIGLEIEHNIYIEECQRAIVMRNRLRETLHSLIFYARSNFQE